MENYRQHLRQELKNRKFAHKHYSQKQIEEFRNRRRQELESSIANSKSEIEELKPKRVSPIGNIIQRIFVRGKKK